MSSAKFEFEVNQLLKSPDLNRPRWRRIAIEKIVNKQYRHQDIVKYEVKFEGQKNPIWFQREDLKKYRSRGYLKQLGKYDKDEEFRIDKVVGRKVEDSGIW